MSKLIIVKLGGSVITVKQSGKPKLRTRTIIRLAKEIAEWRSTVIHREGARMILLYGGGSFGHPLAHRYHLQNRVLNAKTLAGAGRTIAAMRELGNRLSSIFLDAGIPVVPLQTSSFVRKVNGRIVLQNLILLETILKHGGVPFLGGDVVFADSRRTVIASADELAAVLGSLFHVRKVLFATNVDGVYKRFPPRTGERPLQKIDRGGLRGATASRGGNNAHDVTGAMVGKLKALLPLRNCEALIFNALRSGVLNSVLRGEYRGTTVVL